MKSGPKKKNPAWTWQAPGSVLNIYYDEIWGNYYSVGWGYSFGHGKTEILGGYDAEFTLEGSKDRGIALLAALDALSRTIAGKDDEKIWQTAKEVFLKEAPQGPTIEIVPRKIDGHEAKQHGWGYYKGEPIMGWYYNVDTKKVSIGIGVGAEGSIVDFDHPDLERIRQIINELPPLDLNPISWNIVKEFKQCISRGDPNYKILWEWLIRNARDIGMAIKAFITISPYLKLNTLGVQFNEIVKGLKEIATKNFQESDILQRQLEIIDYLHKIWSDDKPAEKESRWGYIEGLPILSFGVFSGTKSIRAQLPGATAIRTFDDLGDDHPLIKKLLPILGIYKHHYKPDIAKLNEDMQFWTSVVEMIYSYVSMSSNDYKVSGVWVIENAPTHSDALQAMLKIIDARCESRGKNAISEGKTYKEVIDIIDKCGGEVGDDSINLFADAFRKAWPFFVIKTS